MNKYLGHFAFEGIDGSGKTTLRKLLENQFGDDFYGVGQHSWLDPYSSKIISDIRTGKNNYSNQEIIDAYFSDKMMLQKYMIDRNKNKELVISDRSFISDCVYLSALYDLDMTALYEKYKLFFELPDRIFYIYTDIATAIERIESRNKQTRHYENFVSLSLVASKYEELFSIYTNDFKSRLIKIDNSNNLQSSLENILHELNDEYLSG